MTTSNKTSGLFTHRFKKAYLDSLHDHRFFYDDIAEIGNAAEARHVFYFVPGMNGTPGQMRFVLPSIIRNFGPSVYLRALYLPEFSAHAPIWEKYTPTNLERRLDRLRSDLTGLLACHSHFTVICSSNGLYDFCAAVETFKATDIESRIQLIWGACAPDNYSSTPWEKVFFPLNGFVHHGHRWFAYPNHNFISVLNPETGTSFDWQDRHPRRLHKVDLESRFRCFGLQWDYLSTGQLGEAARYMVRKIQRPWHGPAEALVAENDGFWQGVDRPDIEQSIRRYLPNAHCEFKDSSHLWVVNPTNVTELFSRLKRSNTLQPLPCDELSATSSTS